MAHISIDLETLGTNVDSQILSIGACEFDAAGNILDTFYKVIDLNSNIEQHMKVTPGTLDFWLAQPAEARDAIWGYDMKVHIMVALGNLANWLNTKEYLEMWANGTKFDLGMLEYAYKANNLPVPWGHNADRCMRTLRKFAGNIDINYCGVSHHALHDAIWQAKYIAAACDKLGVELC